MKWSQLSRDEEVARMLREYEHRDFDGIMMALERQFSVLHNRAQLLLTLCGIVITLTGFSGRLIAGTNIAAQIFVIVGLAVTLVAAAIIVWGVLHLHWLTAQVGENRAAWLARSLAYRDMKTAAYRMGMRVLVVGMALYCVAIAIMLVNPHQAIGAIR